MKKRTAAILKVVRLRESAKLPIRAHNTDAGMDLYFSPNESIQEQIVSIMGYPVPSRESVLLSTGIKVEFPSNYMLEIKNKSGIAHKRQLVIGACVVDSGYTGELFVNLHNIGWKTQYLKAGDKIAQAILIPIEVCDIEETSEELFNKDTSRGEGGFGSTGTR
jgi:dUTP pyrophosphatase